MQVSSFNRHKKIFLLAGAAVLLTLSLSACEIIRDHAPAPVIQLGTQIDSQYGSILSQNDDTVWKISQRYNLPLRDIIDLNGLEPPYKLSSGQRLKLPAPREHRVGKLDTLHSLARMYRAPISQLVRMNGLKPPYLLQVGQVIRLPSSAETGQQETMVAENYPEPVTATPTETYVAQEPLPPSNTSIVAVELPPPAQQAVVQEELPVTVVAAAKPPAPTLSMPMPSAPSVVMPTARPPMPLTARPAPASPPPQVVLGSKRPDFTWPVRGKVLSSYGQKSDGLFNDGINIAAPKGTPIAAAADGVVAYVGNDLASYGNLVLIRHSGGMVTAYSHMSNIAVGRDTPVKKGQAIGTVGSTGNVANSQLHFEIRKGTQTLDPKKFL